MGRTAIADGVVDARGASRTQFVLARARDRSQGARRRAGHGRDWINARYRTADPRSTRQRPAQVISQECPRAAALSGRSKEAQQAMARAREMYPAWRLSHVRKMRLFRRPEDVAKYVE